MVDVYLFEISCAEELGNYKLADELDIRLIKIASSNPKNIKKDIQKFAQNSTIKDVQYSMSCKKFTVFCSSTLTKSNKDKIKNLAFPYPVSYIIDEN